MNCLISSQPTPHLVPQTSPDQIATVSKASKSADGQPTWKSATRQAWKPAARRLALSARGMFALGTAVACMVLPRTTFAAQSGTNATQTAGMVSTEKFVGDASRFLEGEIAAHMAAVRQFDPPQETVLGVSTKGEFTWGSFMRALTECSALRGSTNIGGRDVPQWLGKLGLIESRLGGKTFSQLGAALALRRFGMDLATNAVWQSLSPSERDEWRALLNPERFYNLKTHHVINLPENYMGVASRIAAYDYLFGITTNRAFADDVLEHAAGQFLRGVLYTDDNQPTGRYDRYSQEYARFIYDASRNLGREDVRAAVEPALKSVMRTWWALVGTDGCGYPWGRTIGAISYQDTMEIIGFLAQHPEFRPAPIGDLASVYHAAWLWLQKDYQTNQHLLNMFGFGRGNYHYMTPERQWQQTTAYLYKSADTLRSLADALRAEGVASFPAQPPLPEVARFDFFRRGDRLAGAWLVRRGQLRFALPITTGIRPGIADYLPAPHGLPGFAAPVEQMVPAMVPYLELEDGRVIAACDGADEITPGKDGQSLRAAWRRWALVGLKDDAGNTNADLPFGVPEEFIEPGLTAEVSWTLTGETLTRSERVTAARPIKIRRWWVLVPSTGSSVSTRYESGRRIDLFNGAEAALEVTASSKRLRWTESLRATGNSALGRGTRGAIPLILTLEADDFEVTPTRPLDWTVQLRELPL